MVGFLAVAPERGDRVVVADAGPVWVVLAVQDLFALLHAEGDASSEFILPWTLTRPRLAS